MRKIMLAFAASTLPLYAALADEELPGTYKLISFSGSLQSRLRSHRMRKFSFTISSVLCVS
jgi:hypothetical protein